MKMVYYSKFPFIWLHPLSWFCI